MKVVVGLTDFTAMSAQKSKRNRRTIGKASKMSIKSVVKREVHQALQSNTMIKYLDSVLIAQNVTAVGIVSALYNVPQGDAQSQRVGDVIFIRDLELTFSLEMANADVYTTSRIIIFQWKPNSLPTVSSILQTPTANTCYSQYNFQNQDMYVVHYDKLFHQSGTATNPTETSNVGVLQQKVRVGHREVEYSLGSTTAMTNQSWILYISDSAIVPFPVINWLVRVRYAETKA